jgi:hypothetical protein
MRTDGILSRTYKSVYTREDAKAIVLVRAALRYTHHNDRLRCVGQVRYKEEWKLPCTSKCWAFELDGTYFITWMEETDAFSMKHVDRHALPGFENNWDLVSGIERLANAWEEIQEETVCSM